MTRRLLWPALCVALALAIAGAIAMLAILLVAGDGWRLLGIAAAGGVLGGLIVPVRR